jgi:hypothetical protein
MSEYVPDVDGDGFAQASACFGEIVGWLVGPDAGGLEHGRLEQELGARGRELLRVLLQDHLDLRAAREQRREKVTGSDGITRTRAETGHTRPLTTVFGQVTVTRDRLPGTGGGECAPGG